MFDTGFKLLTLCFFPQGTFFVGRVSIRKLIRQRCGSHNPVFGPHFELRVQTNRLDRHPVEVFL